MLSTSTTAKSRILRGWVCICFCKVVLNFDVYAGLSVEDMLHSFWHKESEKPSTGITRLWIEMYLLCLSVRRHVELKWGGPECPIAEGQELSGSFAVIHVV